MTVWKLDNHNRLVQGSVEISGAKNSALKLLSASLLGQESILNNLDFSMQDLLAKREILKALGVEFEQLDRKTWKLNCKNLNSADLSQYEGRPTRTTILLVGALIHKFEEVVVPIPGGCKLGPRPIDLHLKLFEAFGLEVEPMDYCVRVARGSKPVSGIEYTFEKISTGATENGILLGCMAQGKTTLYNAHTRPEVVDLCNFLNQMGAKIEIPCSGVIQIEGPFQPFPVKYDIIFDNMEAMTYTILCGLAHPDSVLEIKNYPTRDLIVPLEFLKEIGLRFYESEDSTIVKNSRQLGAFQLSTGPYPGINSDMQPLFAALAHRCIGWSRIIDVRFAQRFGYIEEFSKLGGHYQLEDNRLTIPGTTKQKLSSGTAKATDLRAGAALIALSFITQGPLQISNMEQVLRGYSNLEKNLLKVGARVETVEA